MGGYIQFLTMVGGRVYPMLCWVGGQVYPLTETCWEGGYIHALINGTEGGDGVDPVIETFSGLLSISSC